MENKPASSLVVSLGKALNETPRKWQLLSECGRPNILEIAMQFAFSRIYDKHGQYNTKKAFDLCKTLYNFAVSKFISVIPRKQAEAFAAIAGAALARAPVFHRFDEITQCCNV